MNVKSVRHYIEVSEMPLKLIRTFKTNELEDAFNQFEANPEVEIISVEFVGQDIEDPMFGCMIYYKTHTEPEASDIRGVA
jgi:hypothetical protein